MAKRLIEIRTYKLRPGVAADFHAAMTSVAVPLVREWGMDVVAFGPSPDEPDGYFLIRAYDDMDDLTAQQDAFYGSDVWRKGPRSAIVPQIETYLNTVLWLSAESIEDMRRSNSPGG